MENQKIEIHIHNLIGELNVSDKEIPSENLKKELSATFIRMIQDLPKSCWAIVPSRSKEDIYHDLEKINDKLNNLIVDANKIGMNVHVDIAHTHPCAILLSLIKSTEENQKSSEGK